MSLLNGIDENLMVALSEQAAGTGKGEDEATDALGETSNKVPSQSNFLASRLSQLRFLLYDDLRLASQKGTP
jgi:hypothetical protein